MSPLFCSNSWGRPWASVRIDIPCGLGNDPEENLGVRGVFRGNLYRCRSKCHLRWLQVLQFSRGTISFSIGMELMDTTRGRIHASSPIKQII
jgi:hypothetical protein